MSMKDWINQGADSSFFGIDRRPNPYIATAPGTQVILTQAEFDAKLVEGGFSLGRYIHCPDATYILATPEQEAKIIEDREIRAFFDGMINE